MIITLLYYLLVELPKEVDEEKLIVRPRRESRSVTKQREGGGGGEGKEEKKKRKGDKLLFGLPYSNKTRSSATTDVSIHSEVYEILYYIFFH